MMNIGLWKGISAMIIVTILISYFDITLGVMFFTMDMLCVCWMLDEYKKIKNKKKDEKDIEKT